MLKIKIYSKKYREEIEYVFKHIFQQIGIVCDILKPGAKTNSDDYVVEYGTKESGCLYKKKLFIPASDFFGADYLNENSLPRRPLNYMPYDNSIIDTVHRSLPILYSKEQTAKWIKINHDRADLNIDIIASIFFMLTRYEEYVIEDRDPHNRFLSQSGLAVMEDFFHRALVDEYVQLFSMVLKSIGIQNSLQETAQAIFLSHDIDAAFRCATPWRDALSIGADILRGNKCTLPLKCVFNLYKGFGFDPFDTYGWLMDQSESVNAISTFFFMSGGVTEHDNLYNIKDKKVVTRIKEIQKRGHRIGLHGSYYSYNNIEILKTEKNKLEEVIGEEVRWTRQHFLRFEVPTTWKLMDQLGFQWDSTLGFPDLPGFRCGTCRPFQTFDIIEGKSLNLKEVPLIVMDGSLKDYMKLDPETGFALVNKLYKETIRHRGTMNLLWHNTALDPTTWAGWKENYSKFISDLRG